MDAISGPFTFVPEDDQDFYGLFLGEQPSGLETTVTIRATSGLDLVSTISRADTGEAVGAISSPAISTTLAADLSGWLVLRVENRAPGLASGQSYRIELRRTLPPPPTTMPTPEGFERVALEPDALENNYSPETAAPIAVGVLYDLNFVCPVVDGCPGGDHDYLRFDAKAGMRYLITTFDLAPGVDTVLDLFIYDGAIQGWMGVATNDDERPGAAFLSTLRWQAPADGPVLLRIGPRDGGLQPVLSTDEPASTYRVALALAESDLATQLEQRIAQQTNAPTPTVQPSAAPIATARPVTTSAPAAAPAAPAEPTTAPITESAGEGQVVITDDAPAYTSPSSRSEVLAVLPTGTQATLTGNVSGLWAEITTADLVGTAWIDRRRLRPTGTAAPATTTVAGTPAAGTPTAGSGTPSTGMATPSAPGTSRAVVIQPLPSPLQPTPIVAPEPVTARATVMVLQRSRPVAGMRVMLMDVFDTTLVELVTGADGRVALTATVRPGTALYVVIPALGVRERLHAADPTMTIQLPEAR
jgi:hypothetical protein